MTNTFVIASVPGAGASVDGETIVALADDGAGNQLELVAPHAVFDRVISAFAKGSKRAFDNRRASGKLETFIELDLVAHLRFYATFRTVYRDRFLGLLWKLLRPASGYRTETVPQPMSCSCGDGGFVRQPSSSGRRRR
jgi:hypothetical protein